MRRHLGAAWGLAAGLAFVVAGSTAQAQLPRRGGVWVPGVALYTEPGGPLSYQSGSGPAPIVTPTELGGGDSGLHRGESALSSAYAGRVAPWVPGGGSMNVRSVPTPSLLRAAAPPTGSGLNSSTSSAPSAKAPGAAPTAPAVGTDPNGSAPITNPPAPPTSQPPPPTPTPIGLPVPPVINPVPAPAAAVPGTR